jgi:hypothetical protein
MSLSRLATGAFERLAFAGWLGPGSKTDGHPGSGDDREKKAAIRPHIGYKGGEQTAFLGRNLASGS